MTTVVTTKKQKTQNKTKNIISKQQKNIVQKPFLTSLVQPVIEIVLLYDIFITLLFSCQWILYKTLGMIVIIA